MAHPIVTHFILAAVLLPALTCEAAAPFSDDGGNGGRRELALAIEETEDGDLVVSPIRRAVAFSASALEPSVAEERVGLAASYRWRPSVSRPRHSPSVLQFHGEYDHRSHPTTHHVAAHPVTVHPLPVLPPLPPHPDPPKPIVTPIEYTPTAYPAFPAATSSPAAAADFPAYTPHHGHGDAAHEGEGDVESGGVDGDSGVRPQQPRDYFPPPSVLGVLEDEEATTFLSLLERAGLLETLGGEKTSEEFAEERSEEGPWTVFAPTNDAFANMDPDTIDALSNNDDLLERVLKYHIVPNGKIFTRIVKDNLLAPSLEGTDLRFNKKDGAGGVITINGAELALEKSDQRAANGVVHFLNDVIYPLPVGSLYDTLDDDSRFVTLVRAINVAELVDELDDNGPYTIFAPTDGAFDKISQEALNDLLDDKEALSNLLLKHVVPGTKLSRDLTFTELKSAAGDKLGVRTRKGRVFVNDAAIVDGDIIGTNGAIQVIDKVLL